MAKSVNQHLLQIIDEIEDARLTVVVVEEGYCTNGRTLYKLAQDLFSSWQILYFLKEIFYELYKQGSVALNVNWGWVDIEVAAQTFYPTSNKIKASSLYLNWRGFRWKFHVALLPPRLEGAQSIVSFVTAVLSKCSFIHYFSTHVSL